MSYTRRILALLLLAVLLGSASGCFSGSANPSYFPYLLPTFDVIRGHAKPVGPGYYANFDPHAIDLVVEPQVMTSQVNSQVVVLATVRDDKEVPRRQRRIDWKVANGNIIEVDESGFMPGRGGIEGNTAFSYTSHGEHRLTRGNNNNADDVMIRPGQSWCVVSSPVEGDTHVTVVVPGIYNWDKRMKTVVVRWVDAVWELPQRAVAKFGTEHEFVTKIARFTDRQPLAKYRVRYKILDGPPAVLLPSRAQEDTVISDLSGIAKVRIAQLSPASGTNRIAVEVIRPPDPTTPTGSGVTIISGETAIDWLAPSVKLGHVGPVSAAVEQNVTFTTTARNEGRMNSDWVEFTLPIPEGLEFVSSNPPAEPRGNQIQFTFPSLPIGQTHAAQTTFKSRRAGPIRSIAIMRTGDGQNDQQEFNTLITTPQLKADILAPKTGIVEAPINFVIRLTNPGTGDLDEVLLIVGYDIGLEHEMVKNPANDPKMNVLKKEVKNLKAGETRDEFVVLTPRRAGAMGVRVTASGGGLQTQANHIVNVQKPNVSLRVEGPAKRYVGRPAEWKIIVKNESEAEQTGVVVRDRLPAELRFVAASRGGAHLSGDVTWNVGTLKPGEEVVLELTTEALKAAAAADKLTSLSADGNVRAEKSARIEIEGIAALRMELRDESDPVEIGKNAAYVMTLTNTGSAPAKLIDVKATVPDLLKAIKAIGPTKETIALKSVTFDRIETLQPGSKIVFRFECQALKEGKAYFRVEYTSALNERPLFEEEVTTIAAPFQNPLPPPPGGGVSKPLPKE
ncbi:MAG: DUF11 domain-containing protein [Gemmataceae bacterium]|nr:DUF11 domain-containing protein [Gemmataceae bacterium]